MSFRFLLLTPLAISQARAVGHHEAVELGHVVHQELLEAHVVTAAVLRVLVGTITDGRLARLTAESATEGTIDTLRASPARVADAHEAVHLVTRELLVALLVERVLADCLLSHGSRRF